MKIDPHKNTIVCGDNLEWLNWIPDESVDMCYIDPPFFSNQNYEIIWGNGAEVASFGDRFSGGIEKYIDWMKPRIELIHQKLKPTGSIFLHCDRHASHRLRYQLDEIFGEKNFVNEIVWHYRTFQGQVKKYLAHKHDTILFYRVGHKYTFNQIYDTDVSDTYDSGRWGKYLQNGNQILGNKMPPDKRFQRYLNKFIKKTGRKPYPNEVILELQGQPIDDVWDIKAVNINDNSERMGYKTQKPLSLIERIIQCGTNENDMVLDCFGGGMTTANACSNLNRKFITGDVSPVAVQIGADRIHALCPDTKFEIKGLPQSVEQFKSLDGHEFAELICDVMGWTCNPKKTNDGGKDAWDGNKNPIEIKNGFKNSVGRTIVQKLHSRIIADKKKYGAIVGWKFSRQAIEYVADLKNNHNVNIELKDAENILASLILPELRSKKIQKLYEEKRVKFQKNIKSKKAA